MFSSNVPLVLDVCSPLCGPDRGLHHLNNPMHTLFPPYPNRIALDIYQSLAAPFIRSTTTPPQLPHINSWASELCPPPSTGALTRLWRYIVSDIGGIPAFDTTPSTAARLPGAGSHNELKVRSRASSGTISAISARYLLHGLHTRQTLAPSPSSSFLPRMPLAYVPC